MCVYFWNLYAVSFIYVPVLVLVPYCFDYDSFVVQFEVRAHYTSNFVFFFLKISLSTQGLFGFINFSIIHPSCMRYAMGILIRIALNLYIAWIEINPKFHGQLNYDKGGKNI